MNDKKDYHRKEKHHDHKVVDFLLKTPLCLHYLSCHPIASSSRHRRHNYVRIKNIKNYENKMSFRFNLHVQLIILISNQTAYYLNYLSIDKIYISTLKWTGGHFRRKYFTS